MAPLARRAVAVSAPLLLALSLTACGGRGGSDAPDDAATDDFCKAFDSFDSIDPDDADEAIDAAHDLADDLSEVGSPDDLNDQERNGFEKFVDFLGDVDSRGVDRLKSLDTSDVFGDDAGDVEEFLAYLNRTCPPEVGIPTAISSPSPSQSTTS